jgi:hypothetical protein
MWQMSNAPSIASGPAKDLEARLTAALAALEAVEAEVYAVYRDAAAIDGGRYKAIAFRADKAVLHLEAALGFVKRARSAARSRAWSE